jgi:hypothetical protein
MFEVRAPAAGAAPDAVGLGTAAGGTVGVTGEGGVEMGGSTGTVVVGVWSTEGLLCET